MTKKEKTVEIPIEGSLGILAHGDIGLLSWRKKRDLELKKKKTNTNTSKKSSSYWLGCSRLEGNIPINSTR